ncbi:hypothetical protein PAXINDRAFT_12709 [Paxillus involutus ATCC 200175]|uniref:Uncharacterized protein n=1 Tax=Paxillus involutus ATCC 200175 TaxID=664439 RepID=A0A0C9U643_PAXIN|nr:hypothetical protein PAXINDRAFT_12709 [Paxillus involutus ATCC 200175]
MNQDNSLLPKYFDLYPQVLPPLTSKTMDALFSTPRNYTVRTWCDAILPLTPAQPSPIEYLLTDARHYKYRLNMVQHEYMLLYILRSAPFSPQTPHENLRYCMKVSRTIQVDETAGKPGRLARMGIFGPAIDEVEILPQGPLGANSQDRHHLLSELKWGLVAAPPITKISEILLYISNSKPTYNLFSTQCYFFSRAAYETFKGIYPPYEHRGKKFFKAGHFFCLAAGTPSAIEISEAIASFYSTLDSVERLKAIGDRGEGPEGSGGRLADKGKGPEGSGRRLVDRGVGTEGSGRLVGSGRGSQPAAEGLPQSISMPTGVHGPVLHMERMPGHLAVDFLARFVEGFRGSISMTITTDM